MYSQIHSTCHKRSTLQNLRWSSYIPKQWKWYFPEDIFHDHSICDKNGYRGKSLRIKTRKLVQSPILVGIPAG